MLMCSSTTRGSVLASFRIDFLLYSSGAYCAAYRARNINRLTNPSTLPFSSTTGTAGWKGFALSQENTSPQVISGKNADTLAAISPAVGPSASRSAMAIGLSGDAIFHTVANCSVNLSGLKLLAG